MLKIKNILKKMWSTFLFYKDLNIPNPHAFVNSPLQSATIGELTNVIIEVSELLPQFSDFINQFDQYILSKGVNIITDTAGNMTMDFPANVPDNEAGLISRRISVLDGLITQRREDIAMLLEKGQDIESQLRQQNPNMRSQILEKVNEFNRLKNCYKH